MTQLGITMGDVPMDGTTPARPPVAQATEEARKAQVSYEQSLELHGTDHPITKFTREQLDKELAKVGPTAHPKNLKQISDQKLSISKHGDEETKDQSRLRDIQQKRLEHLESELVQQKTYLAQMELTFKHRNELIAKALQRTVEMEQQVKALEEAGQPEQAGATGPTASLPTHGLPSETLAPSVPLELIQTLQTFVTAIRTVPDIPQAAQEQLDRLQSSMQTHLQTPPPGTSTPGTPAEVPNGTYGKAPTVAAFGCTRDDPYGTATLPPPAAATRAAGNEIPEEVDEHT